MTVVLKISRPVSEFPEVKAAKIIVPAAAGDLTVLPDRAPTYLLLRNGQVKALDADNHIVRRFFVHGGVTDIAQDVCRVEAEIVHAYDDMTLEEAKQCYEKAATDEIKDYYKVIIDEFTLSSK